MLSCSQTTWGFIVQIQPPGPGSYCLQDVLQLYPAHTTCPWPAQTFHPLHTFGTQLYSFGLAICHKLAIPKPDLATDLYHLPSKPLNFHPAGASKCLTPPFPIHLVLITVFGFSPSCFLALCPG